MHPPPPQGYSYPMLNVNVIVLCVLATVKNLELEMTEIRLLPSKTVPCEEAKSKHCVPMENDAIIFHLKA